MTSGFLRASLTSRRRKCDGWDSSLIATGLGDLAPCFLSSSCGG